MAKNFSDTSNNKPAKLYRICADYRPVSEKIFKYVILAHNVTEAKSRWHNRFPWLDVIEVREATKDEADEFVQTIPNPFLDRIAVWRPGMTTEQTIGKYKAVPNE